MCVVYLWEVTTFFTTLSPRLFGHAPPVQAGIDTFRACVARHRIIYVELGPLRHGVVRNAARVAATQKRWRLRNPGVARARANEARTLRLKRRVAWANAAAIVSFHREAQWLTESTGRLHVVDHIIPLNGRTVSGLDVANNLRVVEASANAHKTNKWESLGWERPCASSGDVPLASGDAPPSQLALF